MSFSDSDEDGWSTQPVVEYISAAELGDVELGKEEAEWNSQGRSLYLCVADYHVRGGKVRYSVYRINLKALLFSKNLKLGTAFAISNNLGAWAGFGMGHCSTLLLAGGFEPKYLKELVVAEPRRDILKIHIRDGNNSFHPHPAPFLDGKVKPLLWNVEGNLFALARNPPPPSCSGSIAEWRNCFEMYQPSDCQWVNLPDPPSYAYPIAGESGDGVAGVDEPGDDEEMLSFADVKENESITRFCYYSSFSFTILGCELIVSNPYHPEHSYKCNLSRVHEICPVEWEVSPFQFEGATLGVQTTQGFVVFSHAVNSHDLIIKVHLLITGSGEPVLTKSLRLPPQDHEEYLVQDSQFVDLGGQKVCFLYSKTIAKSKLVVTAITFGFHIEEGNKIGAKFYSTQKWEFQDKGESHAHVWGVEQMVGAVVG